MSERVWGRLLAGPSRAQLGFAAKARATRPWSTGKGLAGRCRNQSNTGGLGL